MLWIGGPQTVWAQDFQQGYDAFLAEEYETAMQTLMPLAENGNARAQAVVGFMFLNGFGVPADDAIAARWYLSSAAKGDARAQYILALLYMDGRGVPQNNSEALRYLQLAAAQEHSTAQYDLSGMYRRGDGIEKDIAKADHWLQRAAEGGHIDAQFDLGVSLYFAEGPQRDVPGALTLWHRAAEEGHSVAQFNLAEIYRIGSEVPEDLPRAVSFYETSAAQGYVLSQQMLGKLFKYGYGVAEDAAQAARWFRLAAEQGDQEAQFELGYLYAQGNGVPQSWPEAVQWYLLAAEQGHEIAQLNLGSIFRDGKEGVAADPPAAFEWFRRAAEQGNANAQMRLALAHRFGVGAPKNLTLAAEWYHKAAAQDEKLAQHALGSMYQRGDGVVQDPVQAAKWYRLAADQGYSSAQYDLGFMIYHGRGVPVNYSEAARLYRLAAEQGHAKAQSILGFLHEIGRGVRQDAAESAKWYDLAKEQGVTYTPERALAIRQFELSQREFEHGIASREVLEPLYDIGEIYFRDFLFITEARDIFKHGYEIAEATLGPHHETTIDFLGGYSAREINLGRYDIALDLTRDLLTRMQNTFGPTDKRTLQAMGNLASILENTGRTDEANQIMQEGMTLAFAIYGPDSDIVTSKLFSQSMSLGKGTQSENSFAMLRDYAEQSERDYGRASLRTLDIRERIAVALAEYGRHIEAAEVWADIVEGQEERLLLTAVLDSAARGAALQDAKRSGRALVTQAWAAGLMPQGNAGPIRFREADYDASELGDMLAVDAFYAAQLGETGAAEAVARAMTRLTLRDAGLQRIFASYEMAQAEVISFGNDISAIVAQPTARDAETDARILHLQEKRAKAIEQVRDIGAELEGGFPRVFEIMAPRPVSIADVMGTAGSPPLLGPNEALILLTPPQGDAPGIVWAVSRERFAWAEMTRSEQDLKADIKYLHALLDPSASSGNLALAAGNRGTFSLTNEPTKARLRVFDRSFAHQLYETLLGDPSIQGVIAEKSEWILAPQGMLLSLPFSTLVMDVPNGGARGDADPDILRATKWLGTNRALSVVPAVSSLRALRASGLSVDGTRQNPFFGLGDPVFSHATNPPPASPIEIAQAYMRSGVADAHRIGELPQLPGTRLEIERLAAAFNAPESAVLLGQDASETALAQAQATGLLPSSRVIVLATHGLMAGAFDTLGEPALAMTPPYCGPDVLNAQFERGGAQTNVCAPSLTIAELQAAAADGAWIDDGLLTASEVTQLDLNADWVILSACDTAAGEDQSPDAEGLSGLARSFFFAGARSLLVSHWPVRDDVAATLTPDAVAHALDGRMSRAEAVRRAMVAVMNDTSLDATSRSFAHPAAWAPFQVTGVNANGA